MASLNRVELIGNIGKEPEFKILQGGAAYLRFSLATSEKWKDKTTGDKKEDTEWNNCVIWGAQAEIANKYLSKGKQVYIEGKNKTRSWDDPGGARDNKGNVIKHYRTEVVVSKFLMLGKREDSPNNGGLKADGSYDYGDPNPDTGGFEVGELGPPLDDGFEDSAPLNPG